MEEKGQTVGNRDEKNTFLTKWIERIDKRPTLYFIVAILVYMFINNTINATSVWMEVTRDGEAQISLWEPFVWEYSSLIANVIVLPFLMMFWRAYPLRFEAPLKQVGAHILVSLLYAISHVVLMVLLRELIYSLANGNYSFGPWLREFFYEYRKDVWGYLFVLMLFTLFKMLYSRLKGEANFLNDSPSTSDDSKQTVKFPEYLLVRKLDKEFLLKTNEIEWMESSGNYVNLYSNNRIYPLRGTLTEMTDKLSSKFTRIHRSYSVNHDAIESISYQPSGDGEITLKNGQQLNLSRRYKDAFKQNLSL
ncbi:LytTR family transcriptional regulator DNA-binding domain-containing protein [Glaciecola sp. 1036]|uniref:LytR/AlgR family response regulator transcription factor n=1 Tax=Alteromonadaceae TaxID=72275 RepID=UPI003D05D6CA